MGNYKCWGKTEPLKIPASGGLPERTCYDIYEGNEKERKDTEEKDLFLKDALVNKGQLFLWSQAAYHIFQSVHDSYWNHSHKSWEKNFGKSAYYIDLIDYLCNRHDRKKGDIAKMSTGLSLASSLNEVETAAGDMASKLIGRKLKGSDFIKCCNLEPFHDENSKNKQKVFYTLAGVSDRYGKTFQYGYNVFGLAFYNFRLKIVSDGKKFNSAIDKYKNIDEAIADLKRGSAVPGFTYNSGNMKSENVDLLINKSSIESQGKSIQTVGTSETVSNSITNSREYSFSEMIGGEIELEDIFKINSTTIKMEFTAQQAFSTAYGEERSHGIIKESSVEISERIPPHTQIEVNHETGLSEISLSYDCPVMVQFDVAVFSICGTCYDDSAAVHTFSTAGYDQRSFITVFGGDKSDKASSDGSENIYDRFYKSDSMPGYDKAHGLTILKSNRKGKLSDELDWRKIKGQTKAETQYTEDKDGTPLSVLEPAELIKSIYIKRPMSPTGAVLTENIQNKTLYCADPIPLYALASIRQIEGSPEYHLGVGDVLYLRTCKLNGFDEFGVPFYGFDEMNGKWVLVDKDGHEAGSDAPAVILGNIEDYGYCVKGIQNGEVYVKYTIDKSYSCKGIAEIPNSSVKTAAVKISVHEGDFNGRIAASGAINLECGKEVNMESFNQVNVHIFDEKDKCVNVPVQWESDDDRLKITGNYLSADRPGKYKVRAKYEGLVSDEIDVIINDIK